MTRRLRVSRYAMPVLSTEVGAATACVVSFMLDRSSFIRAALLPGSPLQAIVAEQDRGQQERHHRSDNGRALAQAAAGDRALEGQRGHEVRRVERAAAREHVDELEVGEREQ